MPEPAVPNFVMPTTHVVMPAALDIQTFEVSMPDPQPEPKIFHAIQEWLPEPSEPVVSPEPMLAEMSTVMTFEPAAIETYDITEPEPEPLAGLAPESVAQRLEDFYETAAPEEITLADSLTICLEQAVEKFQELLLLDINNEGRLAEAEQAIAEQYEELLIMIGVKDAEKRTELVAAFIQAIRPKAVEKPAATNETKHIIKENEGTHEHKLGLRWPQLGNGFAVMLHNLLGKLSVGAIFGLDLPLIE